MPVDRSVHREARHRCIDASHESETRGQAIAVLHKFRATLQRPDDPFPSGREPRPALLFRPIEQFGDTAGHDLKYRHVRFVHRLHEFLHVLEGPLETRLNRLGVRELGWP